MSSQRELDVHKKKSYFKEHLILFFQSGCRLKLANTLFIP